jgi:Family of unknown function (DUF6492)
MDGEVRLDTPAQIPECVFSAAQREFDALELRAGETLDMVLPLTARDWERAERLLIPTMRRFCHIPGDLWIVVPVRHVRKARKKFQSDKIRVISEADLIPEIDPALASTLGTAAPVPRGWRLQQLIKLAIARVVWSPFYLCLDADCLFVKNLPYERLVQDGRATMRRRLHWNDSFHPWYRDSAEILGVPISPYNYGITPSVLSVGGVHELFSFLEWKYSTSAELYLFEHPQWTEFALYFTFLDYANRLSRYHFDCQKGLSCNSVWGGGDPEAWNPRLSFDEKRPCLFSVLQSHTVVDVSMIVQKIRDYFESIGSESPV